MVSLQTNFLALKYSLTNCNICVPQDTVVSFLSRESITDEPDLEGRTALMWAAGKGADDVISSMVEISQPDINATDKTGATGG